MVQKYRFERTIRRANLRAITGPIDTRPGFRALLDRIVSNGVRTVIVAAPASDPYPSIPTTSRAD
jgi:hypothetical protein